jgi:hypothetical protein
MIQVEQIRSCKGPVRGDPILRAVTACVAQKYQAVQRQPTRVQAQVYLVGPFHRIVSTALGGTASS